MSKFKISKNSNFNPNIVTINKPIKAIGLSVKTSMSSIFKDVSKILKKYMDYKDKYGIPNQKKPWEYVSLSKNFNENKT